MHRSSVCWSGASSIAKGSDIAVEPDHKRTLFLKAHGIKIGCFENCIVFEHTDLVIGQMQSDFMA
jgi:very-short-patch-repair endonuclease